MATKTTALDTVKLHIEISAPRLRGLQFFNEYNPDEDPAIQSILQFSKGFDDAMAMVASNPDFSLTGREKARVKIASELSTALEKWREKHVAEVERRIAFETATLRRKTEGQPPSDAERLRREIRTEPFVPQSVVDEHAFLEVQAANPEAAGQIGDLQAIRDAYLGFSGAFQNEIENVLLDPGSIRRSRGIEPGALGRVG